MTTTDLPPPREGVEYKLIPDFPEYAVGSDGSFWSRRTGNAWKQLQTRKPSILICHEGDSDGHMLRLPRVILELFVRSPEPGEVACYRQGKSFAVSNLYWAKREGPRKGRGHVSAILTALENGEKPPDIARRLGVSRQRVYQLREKQ